MTKLQLLKTGVESETLSLALKVCILPCFNFSKDKTLRARNNVRTDSSLSLMRQRTNLKFYFLKYLFIYLAASGLSCSTLDLCCVMRDLLQTLAVEQRLSSRGTPA